MNNQIKTKERVSIHGEVYTKEREVNNMLDLVKEESYRLDSRFLEPAAGHGNFLVKILERKLQTLVSKYENKQDDFEKFSIVVVGSIYGIEILEDNVILARKRMFKLFKETYSRIFKNEVNSEFLNSIEYLLRKNIIHGDTLKSKEIKAQKPITFCEWRLEGDKIKRSDFTLESLANTGSPNKEPLFDKLNDNESETDPIKSYKAIPYQEIASLC